MSDTPSEHYQRVKEIILKLNEPTILLRHLEEGGTFQEILDLDDEAMNSLYADAYTLLQNGEHSNAADAFLCLTTLNPYISIYWIGLGLAEQAHRACHAALVAYAMAIVCDEKNPVPYYYAAYCHYLNDDIDEALHSLQLAIERAADNSAYSDIHTRALAAQSVLQERQKRNQTPPSNEGDEEEENNQ